MWDVHGFGVFFWTESTDPSPLELVQETTHRKSWSKSMGLLPWQSPWRGLLFCRLRVSREAQRPRFSRITMKMSWDLKPWTHHVFNTLFFKKGVMQTSTEVVFGKDTSSWRLPKSSKCACSCVRAKPEQPLHYWRSNRRRCHHIQEAPPYHPRAKWVTVIGSLRTNKPENQLQPVVMHQKGTSGCFHTLHLPLPFPISPSLVKVSLKDIADLSQGIKIWLQKISIQRFRPKKKTRDLVILTDHPAPWPKGQRVKGCPQRNDVEKDNAKLAILVEMELSYL